MIPLESPPTQQSPRSTSAELDTTLNPSEQSRPGFEFQKVPTEIISHIFNFLSSDSLDDLKTCTRVSQVFYNEFSKILYKRLHIRTYEVPIKMKLMMPKYRKGYHPFTSEDEELYKRFVERRLGVLKSCEYIMFETRKDVRNTIEVLAEYQISEKPLSNVEYLILDGTLKNLDMSLTIRGEKNKLLANRIWEILEPSHVCVNMDPVGRTHAPYSAHVIFQTLHFIMHNKNRLESISYHNHVYSEAQASRIPNQRYYLHGDNCLTSTLLLFGFTEKKTYGRIDILNCTSPKSMEFQARDPVTWDVSNEKIHQDQISFKSPEETESCVCCGKK